MKTKEEWKSFLLKIRENTNDEKKREVIFIIACLCKVAFFENKKMTVYSIPSFLEEGSCFSKEHVQNALLGIQARWGESLMSVMITHDLNSCVINDLLELITNIRLN